MKLHFSPVTLIYFAFCLLLYHDLTLAATFTAIVVHELTHLVFLRVMGGQAASLTVTPLGLSIERSGLLSHREEIWLSLSAPLANISLAALYWHLGLDLAAVKANLGFGLLNLLPIYPLDGGKALSALLSHHLSESRASQIRQCASLLGLIIFWMFSVGVALQTGGNLSLLMLSVGLFLSSAGKDISHK